MSTFHWCIKKLISRKTFTFNEFYNVSCYVFARTAELIFNWEGGGGGGERGSKRASGGATFLGVLAPSSPRKLIFEI